MRVLVLHGPNVDWVKASFDSLNAELAAKAAALGHELAVFQASSEAALVDEVHRRRDWAEAVIVNPSSLAPVAYALAEVLTLLGKPAFEVQWPPAPRRVSALAGSVEKVFEGSNAYRDALDAVGSARAPAAPTATPPNVAAPRPVAWSLASRTGKSIGRKPRPAEPEAPKKTLGRTAGSAVAVPTGPATLSRAIVKAKVSERLSGKLAPEALASWARAQWQALVNGATVEPGAKDTLEDVLLTLAASAKASDHALLSTIATLDR